MNVHALTKMGFVPATDESLSYLKGISGFSDEQELKIEWDTIKSGILAHNSNSRLFLIFKDKSEKEFVLAFAMTRGLRHMVTVKITRSSMRDLDFEEHIVEEYVKKHINDTLE